MFCKNSPVEREALIAICHERLTKKQKHIINFLAASTGSYTASALARQLEKQLNCSRTAVWQNLNALKRAGLVDFGAKCNAGIPAALTVTGQIVIHGMQKGDGQCQE